MKWLLSLFFCLFLAVSCAPPQAPEYSRPNVPQKTESVLPDIDSTKESVTSALNENRQLKRELDRSETIIKEQGTDIEKALGSAERMLKDLKSDIALKETEMVGLIEHINKVKTNNSHLAQQNAILLFDLASQEENLKVAQDRITKAQERAINKENEANSLRLLLDGEIEKNAQLDKSNKDLKKESEKNAVKAATAGVYRNWVISLAVGFVAYLILKNVAASVWPQASILRRL